MKVSGWVLVLLSAATAFIIGAGGTVLALQAVMKGAPLSSEAWVTAATLGSLAASRDFRGLMSLPPVDVQRPNA